MFFHDKTTQASFLSGVATNSYAHVFSLGSNSFAYRLCVILMYEIFTFISFGLYIFNPLFLGGFEGGLHSSGTT